jgi:hypothetical protein
MTNFRAMWDKVLPKDDLPDLVATLSLAAMNEFLRVHRNKTGDRDLYRREEKLTDTGGQVFFEAEVILGGDRSDHSNKKAKPLVIELFDTPAAAQKTVDEKEYVYAYTYSTSSVALRNTPPAVNAIITASDVHFYFKWPSTTSGPAWDSHLGGVTFKMEAHLHQVELTDDAGAVRQAIEIKPVRLRISKTSMDAIVDKLKAGGANQKEEDLFFALLSYMASTIGPNLAEVISFPVLAVSEHELHPMLFAVSGDGVTLGAKLHVSKYAAALAAQVQAFETQFWAEVENDLFDAARNGPLNEKSVVNFARSDACAAAYRSSLKTTQEKRTIKAVGAPVAFSNPNSQMAVALNEYLLDMIVSKFGNISRGGSTGTVTLVVVRGRLGYELQVGAIDIVVTGSGITGSTPVNAWAGLYYQFKDIKDCKVVWGPEKKAGLGIRGTPKIKLETRPSNGLSVRADFDLGGLAIYTGLGFPVDDLLKLLSKPAMKAIEAILDTIALGISFVVVPAKFDIPGQQTSVELSKFVTSQYTHPLAPASTRNNYAMFEAGVAAS